MKLLLRKTSFSHIMEYHIHQALAKNVNLMIVSKARKDKLLVTSSKRCQSLNLDQPQIGTKVKERNCSSVDGLRKQILLDGLLNNEVDHRKENERHKGKFLNKLKNSNQPCNYSLCQQKQTALKRNIFEVFCWASHNEMSSDTRTMRQEIHIPSQNNLLNFAKICELYSSDDDMNTHNTLFVKNDIYHRLMKVSNNQWKTPGELALIIGKKRNRSIEKIKKDTTIDDLKKKVDKIWNKKEVDKEDAIEEDTSDEKIVKSSIKQLPGDYFLSNIETNKKNFDIDLKKSKVSQSEIALPKISGSASNHNPKTSTIHLELDVNKQIAEKHSWVQLPSFQPKMVKFHNELERKESSNSTEKTLFTPSSNNTLSLALFINKKQTKNNFKDYQFKKLGSYMLNDGSKVGLEDNIQLNDHSSLDEKDTVIKSEVTNGTDFVDHDSWDVSPRPISTRQDNHPLVRQYQAFINDNALLEEFSFIRQENAVQNTHVTKFVKLPAVVSKSNETKKPIEGFQIKNSKIPKHQESMINKRTLCMVVRTPNVNTHSTECSQPSLPEIFIK